MASKKHLTEWTRRKNLWISKEPVMKGVWALKDGGFFIRARPTHPLTNKQVEISLVLRDVRDPLEAARMLRDETNRVLSGGTPVLSIETPTFATCIADFLDEKNRDKCFESEATKEGWAGLLKNYLTPNDWFTAPADRIREGHLELWRTTLSQRIQEGTLAPVTANDIQRKVRQVWGWIAKKYKLSENPAAALTAFPVKSSKITAEQPNSLKPLELGAFLRTARRMFRHHYAQMLLGFFAAQRPSTMRPLRRQGPDTDVLWDEGAIRLRRSHTRRDVVMDHVKSANNYLLYLPKPIMDALWEHTQNYETRAQMQSDLLFPSLAGTFQVHTALQKPFEAICQEMADESGFAKWITPKAMRRTGRDLLRRAGVDIVMRNRIAGHKNKRADQDEATEMGERYETIGDDMREAIEAAMRLVPLDGPTSPAAGGPALWEHRPDWATIAVAAIKLDPKLDWAVMGLGERATPWGNLTPYGLLAEAERFFRTTTDVELRTRLEAKAARFRKDPNAAGKLRVVK